MSPIKWKRPLSRPKIVAIYLTPGPLKAVAHKFSVSIGTASKIRTGLQHGNITAPYRIPLNATLITMACGVDLL